MTRLTSSLAALALLFAVGQPLAALMLGHASGHCTETICVCPEDCDHSMHGETDGHHRSGATPIAEAGESSSTEICAGPDCSIRSERAVSSTSSPSGLLSRTAGTRPPVASARTSPAPGATSSDVPIAPPHGPPRV